KLASMLLTSQIMIKTENYDKSLMLSKVAFRKSMELSNPLLVVDSTIIFLNSINGLGLLYDASKKEQREFMKMIERSEEILKTISKLKINERELRENGLRNLRGRIEHSQLKTVPPSKTLKDVEITIPIEKVKGVGQKAQALKDAGFKSAEELIIASVDELVKIKGIGPASAQKLIDNAKEMMKP
ncbi:MAG: helix-hairpin-helix domain-containing protein, partial [Candidatus Heimdallarchaeota archaeon]